MRLQRRLTARLKIYLVNCLILLFAAVLWQPLVLLLKLFIANHRNKIPQITPITLRWLPCGSRIFYALQLPTEDLGGCAGAFGGV